MGYFHDNTLALRPLTAPNSGFRPGQLGALHSAVAHFSVYEEPATLCLPTGYGKTAVFMALPFVLGAIRVMVIEPSDALRRQTTGHFKSLSILRKIGVIGPEIPDPNAHGQKGRPESAGEWEELRQYDVIVSTPQSTSPNLSPDAPSDLADLIIFDEAHHAPAETWAAYLKRFSSARFVFLTATPFRRDRKAIPGKLAYLYPVSRASRERAFGKVRFTAAPVKNDHDEDEIDRAVAGAAAKQLAEDRAAGFDHRIFARAASIKSARALVGLYSAAGVKVAAIASHISKRHQDKVEEELISGSLEGVVCVDMFGEGYDFPKLKIAALHAPHRSLVPTLQFIGRFARTNDVATGDATLVAPVSRLKDASLRLFQEGVDIAELIDEAAQEQIAESKEDREIVEILKTKRQAESDYDAVTPLSLELYAHTRIFECTQPPDFNLIGGTVGRKLKLVKQWMSDDGLITLLLTVDNSPPNWATSDVLVNVRHDAFLLAYNAVTKLCYVGSTRRTERLYVDLMQNVCEGHHRPVSYEMTRRAVAGLANLRFYNVGLKNTAVNTQGESYRVLTGPRAERAVTAGDARSFVQGHFFGSGKSGEERETVGASSSSRVWSNRSLTVTEYLDWLSALNARLCGTEAVADSQLDLVQPAKVLRELPERIIAAGWNKVVYRSAPRVRLRAAADAPWRFCQLTDLDMIDFAVSENRKTLTFGISAGDVSIPFAFSIREGPMFASNDPDWSVEVMTRLDDWVEMPSWLTMHPPVFYASDKSSFQGVNLMKAPSVQIAALADGDAEALDWSGCAIRIEFNIEQANGQRTVHQHLEQYLCAIDGLEVLLYDHRTGEAADYVALFVDEQGNCRVALYHCKAAGGAPSGGRVNDVYEVAGQLLKSIAYCDAAVLLEHVEHRTNADRHTNPSTFIVGDLERLKALLRETPANALFFEVFGVQPGIAKAKVDEHLADLMAFGLDYVHRGGAARAAWLVSP